MRVRDRVTWLSLLAAVAVSVLAMGGVLRWTQSVVAVLAAIAIGSTAFSARRLARVSPLVALLGLALGLTIVQLVPLPPSVVAFFSPTVEALRADGAELMGVSPWSSLSADPSATLSAAIMLLTLLTIALVALRLATSERGRFRIAAAVGAICGTAACITAVHELLGVRALYGLYEPIDANPILLGPLLNANSLACLTALGAVLSIGLAAHRKQTGWVRSLWLLNTAVCGTVTVATVSRGATLAMVAGALVCVAILVAQRMSASERSRRRRARFMSGALPMAILAGCLVVLVLYSSASKVEHQLAHLSSEEVHDSRSKFAAWRSAMDLLEDTWVVGVGRGGFEATFTRVHPASGLATYAYLENEYLQAVVDWGIPAACLLAVAALWLAYFSARRWRDGAPTAGALGAMVVVAMHSNVDFGLEFLGLAAPTTALAAIAAYVPLREVDRPRPFRGLRVAHAALLIAGAVVLSSAWTTPLGADRRALADGASMTEIRSSIERHPLDYYGYAVAADLLNRAGDPRAIRLLNHAMALHPSHPQLHRMAARMLLRQQLIVQAAVEYAAAMSATRDPRQLIAEIVERIPEPTIATALPLDYANPKLIVSVLLEMNRADIARAWLGRMLELDPRAPRACELLFDVAARGELSAVEVAGRRCMDRLPDYQTRLALAKRLAAQGGEAEVVRLLSDVDSWQLRRDEKVGAWLLLCDAHLALGFVEEAKRCLRRLDAAPDMLPNRRAEVLMRIEGIRQAPRPASPSGLP